jgi:hypothetical protein
LPFSAYIQNSVPDVIASSALFNVACEGEALRSIGEGTRRLIALCALGLFVVAVEAQPIRRAITSVDLQRLANGVLGVMSFTVAPTVTTSSFAIGSAALGNPGLSMIQVGGGFTWSEDTPLYLEGNAAYSRFDPVFMAHEEGEQRPVPVRWEAASATGGVGWDFRLSKEWVFRPIVNVTVGTVLSDLTVAKWWLDNNTDLDLTFLNKGRLNAYGVGGSLMLVYQRYEPEHEDDFELRYTNVPLHSYDTAIQAISGHATAENVDLWGRRKVPTGAEIWDRPVRYVFEGGYTQYLGDQRELGISHMSSVGVGLELDSSAKDIWVTRARALVRYKFGPQFRGWALGLALVF